MDASTIVAVVFLLVLPLLLVAALTALVVLSVKYQVARRLLREAQRPVQEQLMNYRAKFAEEQRSQWLSTVDGLTYRNEIEVEMKFIYPLVKFLGYSDSSFTVRERVPFRVGSQVTVGEADWVLWAKDSRSSQLKPRVIVEAKDPGVALDEDVEAQARSYAFALNAPYYLLVNGRQLLLFRRGVESDECILTCDVTTLVNHWPVLFAHIGLH